MTARYADVIIEIAHDKVDRVFQYRIPEALKTAVFPGVRVYVPFGPGNQEKAGYVVDLSDEADYPLEKIKEIRALDEKGISVEGRQIQIAYWLKSQYGGAMIAALKTVLPVRQKMKPLEKKTLRRLLSPEETAQAARACEKKRQTARARVLWAFAAEEALPYDLICRKLHVTASTLQSLEKQGFIAIEKETCYRNPVIFSAGPENRPALTQIQQRIIREVTDAYRAGKPGVSLVHGVTGSGKTEVYLGIIEEMVAMGRQAIVLIPEIALTYQTLLRFYKRFGERVSVMNSTLSAGEKYDQIERAKAGEIDVIIGPRSALFVPFPALGVIVMDEEHELSYKSELSPKYHARETAIEIAARCSACVVLGSATPSLEAYYRAAAGEYRLYEMKERPGGSFLPTVHTVDLREELKSGNRSVFSRRLRDLMEDRLARGEQIMLFLNRRGYAGFVSCRACGHVMKCPHCDVTLSEHKNGFLVCHYCGYAERKQKSCPVCGSPYLMGFKAGTEQIEEAIHRAFPQARVLRMDADTTRRKESYEKLLSAFANEQADILVGTQMIVKGHDFPKVTLVGVLAADLSLNQNDYRAGERTFQLLTQAAGRAGRGNSPGEVVIQTYQPSHYSVAYAARQDYEGFYQKEIAYRKLMGYPPVEHMLAVLLLSSVQREGAALGEEMTELVKKEMKAVEGLRVIGPAEAGIGKISDIYRHVFYVRHSDYQRLVEVKDKLERFCRERAFKNQTVQFDFDPMNAY